MKRCVIIAGGEYAPIAPLAEDDFVIACDRGIEHARRENIVPDLIYLSRQNSDPEKGEKP